MNIFGIILWAYLLGGEAVLLAIAFNICRGRWEAAIVKGEHIEQMRRRKR